jgi:hypothetical protein
VSHFKYGLKHKLQKELIYLERLDKLHNYIEQVIRINNHLYKLKPLSGKGQGGHHKNNKKGKSYKNQLYSNPIEINNIQNNKKNKKPLNKAKAKVKEDSAYFKYSNKGYFIRDYKKKK